MKPSGQRAFGYARARAWKSRLLDREGLMPLLALTDTERIRHAIDPSPFEKLMRIYALWPLPLMRAMLRLHEIENVKLLWRCVTRHKPFDSRAWIPLGSLATVSPAIVATSPRQLAEALARTPYASISVSVARAYSDDLQAAEIAFDRWASRQLVDEAKRLPKREVLARQLIDRVVEARVERRAPDVQRLCARAFRGDPFSIAPVVALILLAEAEVRAVRGIIERQGDPGLDAALERVL
jgi:vacuolar-type H+-ATPase subunit C/Vma6